MKYFWAFILLLAAFPALGQLPLVFSAAQAGMKCDSVSDDTQRFNNIVGSLSVAGGTLVIPQGKCILGTSPQTLSTAANVTLDFTQQGSIQVQSGSTLTINGPIVNNDDHQIFFGSGTVSGITNSNGINVKWFGALLNGTGLPGVGQNDAPNVLTCLAAFKWCNIPLSASTGTTHVRWASPQIISGATDAARRLTCSGSNNDGFNANTGSVSIDVDMGGQVAGPALWFGDPNDAPFNGPTVDGSCHFRDISNQGLNVGTITTNGTTAVTGNGTNFTAAMLGAPLRCTSGGCSGQVVYITAVAGATSITVSANLTTQAGASYTLFGNSPGAIGTMNISNARFYAGADRFGLGALTPPTVPATFLACTNTGGFLPSGTTIFAKYAWVGPGWGNTQGSGEVSMNSAAMSAAGCTSGSNCACTPVTPASVPLNATGLNVYLGLTTGNDFLVGLPYVVSGGVVDFGHNFNFGQTNTVATPLTCIPGSSETGCTSANTLTPDNQNHSGGYGYYIQGTKNFYCGQGNASVCQNNQFANQNHLGGGASFDSDQVAIDLDSGTAWLDIASFHVNLNFPGLHAIQQETNGIWDDCHIEGGVSTAGPQAVFSGTASMHNCFFESGAAITGFSGVALVKSDINITSGGSLTTAFTDDAASGQNKVWVGNVNGNVAWQPNSDNVLTGKLGSPTKVLTAQFTRTANTDAAFSGFSWTIEPNMQYDLSCKGVTQSASTGGLQLTVTGPASPTNIRYDFEDPVSIATGNTTYNAVIVSAGSTYPTGIGNTVTTAATDMPFTFNMQIFNGATGGQVVVRARSATNTVQTVVQAGFRCTLSPT